MKDIKITDNIVLQEDDNMIRIVEHEKEYNQSLEGRKGKWIYVSYKLGQIGELRKYIRTIWEFKK